MGKFIHGVLKLTEKIQNKNNWEQHIEIINKQLTKTVQPNTSFYLDFWTEKKSLL